MHILIAEPNRRLSAVWQAHLNRQGWEVTCCDDMACALDAVDRCLPDIVILSTRLPNQAALSLADWVGYRLPGTRVIFVSADSFFSDGSIFRLAPNACAFLPATVNPSDLCAMAEYYVAARA